jgi:hypothetical protein
MGGSATIRRVPLRIGKSAALPVQHRQIKERLL